MACVFLRTGELDLPIVRRWEIEIENHWRMFFSLFSKKKTVCDNASFTMVKTVPYIIS